MKQMLIEVYFNYDIVLLSNRGYDCILIFSFKFVFKPISAYKNPCFAKATGGAYSAPKTPQLLWWSIRDDQSPVTRVKIPT